MSCTLPINKGKTRCYWAPTRRGVLDYRPALFSKLVRNQPVELSIKKRVGTGTILEHPQFDKSMTPGPHTPPQLFVTRTTSHVLPSFPTSGKTIRWNRPSQSLDDYNHIDVRNGSATSLFKGAALLV